MIPPFQFLQRQRGAGWSNTFAMALLFLLLAGASAQKFFPPLLGCNDYYTNGVPSDPGECYAVDHSICRWRFDTGCRQVTATYRYYNGGRDGHKYQRYHFVSVSAGVNCNRTAEEPVRSCSVEVDRVACAKCTNEGADYRIITLEDCSNITGVFPLQPQTLNVSQGSKEHFVLVRNETMCNHPALPNKTSSPTFTRSPTYDPSWVEPTTAPTTVSSHNFSSDFPTNSAAPTAPATFSPTADLSTSSVAPSLRRSPSPIKPNSPASGPPSSSPSPTNQTKPTKPPSRGTATVTRTFDGDDDDDKEDPPKTKTLMLYPKFLVSTLPDTADAIVVPPESTLVSLVDATNAFWGDLLRDNVPRLNEYGMDGLAVGAATAPGFFLNFTVVLTLDASSPATTGGVAALMAGKRTLNRYFERAIRPTVPHATRVRAWMVAKGVAVVGARA